MSLIQMEDANSSIISTLPHNLEQAADATSEPQIQLTFPCENILDPVHYA